MNKHTLFRDISRDTKNSYALKRNERIVFFMQDRSGELVFHMDAPGAEAYVFAILSGSGTSVSSLRITSIHSAPDTFSRAIIRGIADDVSAITYNGLIRIEPGAVRSDASQEIRSLILSPEASVSSQPALEILEEDVHCNHSATLSPLNDAERFFIETRGVSENQAKQLLIKGFINDIFFQISDIASPDAIKTLGHVTSAN
jgi:Fe-S cluster assembly protein SufD